MSSTNLTVFVAERCFFFKNLILSEFPTERDRLAGFSTLHSDTDLWHFFFLKDLLLVSSVLFKNKV